MKKFKHIYILLFSVIIVGLSSCIKSEDLNQEPINNISGERPFETKNRIRNQVLGLYSSIRSGNFMGGRMHIYNDVRADNFLSNDPNRVTARAAWEFSEADADNEVNNIWTVAYLAINRANLFLEGMEAQGKEVVGNDSVSNNYIAEARFVRAVAYYGLLQFFARPYPENQGASRGLPLRLTGIQTYGFNDLAPSTVAQVYDQILDDLNFAETNLPVKYNTTSRNIIENDVTRAQQNTAIAYKVRVYMSMAKYPEAATEANKLVPASSPFVSPNGPAHTMVTDISTLFTSAINSEMIFAMPFTDRETPGTQNQLGYYYLPRNYLSGWGIFYLNPNGILGNPEWGTNDARRTYTFVNGGRTWLRKFGKGNPFNDWVPVIRYPEVLLSLAEAIVRNSNSVDSRAIELLNAVRKRSDASVEYEASDFANTTELIDKILLEREIEFLGEGMKSIDILRLGKPFPAKAVPGGASAQEILPSNQAYIWPIPSEETRYNKLMIP